MRKNNENDIKIYKLKKELTASEQHLYNSILSKRKKSKGIAYLLFIFAGIFSLHRFYLREYTYGIVGLFMLFMGWTIGLPMVAVLMMLVVDIVYTSIMYDKNDLRTQYGILNDIINARESERATIDKARDISDPKEIIKENPQVLSELSLNNNRLFSLKGNIRSLEIKDSIDALYNVLSSVISLIKKEDIKPEKLDKIAKFYLPQLISILNSYVSIESNNYSSGQLMDTAEDIKLTIQKIERNLGGIIREANLQKREEINLELEVLKKVMAIEGFENNEIY